MEFNAYQVGAKETAVFPEDQGIVYTTLGLVSEAGEVADKLKKIIRDSNGEMSDEAKLAIKKELGDVLWYVSALAWELGFDLNDVAETNLMKLSSRWERNAIGGSGDER